MHRSLIFGLTDCLKVETRTVTENGITTTTKTTVIKSGRAITEYVQGNDETNDCWKHDNSFRTEDQQQFPKTKTKLISAVGWNYQLEDQPDKNSLPTANREPAKYISETEYKQDLGKLLKILFISMAAELSYLPPSKKLEAILFFRMPVFSQLYQILLMC